MRIGNLYLINNTIEPMASTEIHQDIVVNGSVTVKKLLIPGGTSSQFLKANGVIDKTAYQPAIAGKSLSTNDFTNAYRDSVDAACKPSANYIDTASIADDKRRQAFEDYIMKNGIAYDKSDSGLIVPIVELLACLMGI